MGRSNVVVQCCFNEFEFNKHQYVIVSLLDLCTRLAELKSMQAAVLHPLSASAGCWSSLNLRMPKFHAWTLGLSFMPEPVRTDSGPPTFWWLNAHQMLGIIASFFFGQLRATEVGVLLQSNKKRRTAVEQHVCNSICVCNLSWLLFWDFCCSSLVTNVSLKILETPHIPPESGILT